MLNKPHPMPTGKTKSGKGFIMEIKNGRIHMKVREFIQLSEDFDVYDDVCEEIGIAFCGAQELTEAGMEHFAEVLDYDMELDISGSIKTAVVHIDDDDDRVWKRRMKKAKEFFYGAAGYIEDSKYKKWFVEGA